MFLSFLAAAIAGTLISQGARVWLFFVIVVGTMLAAMATGWTAQASISEIAGHTLVIGIAMQLGYGIGLFGSLPSSRDLRFCAIGPTPASTRNAAPTARISSSDRSPRQNCRTQHPSI